MKKYLIADLLTLSRALLAVVIFVLTCASNEPITGWVLLIFCVGSMTDALDGEFARKFPYPRDRKYRWWRDYHPEVDLYQYEINDIIADLMIGLATLIYIAAWVNPLIGGFYLGASIGVGVYVYFATNAEIFSMSQTPGTVELTNEIREFLILLRRKWYAGGIAIVVFTLIVAAKLPALVTILLVVIGFCVGIYLVQLKKPTRLKHDKTPL